MKRFLAGSAFLVALGFAASASAVPVNFTGESFHDAPDFTDPGTNFSYLHDGPSGGGTIRYNIADGVAVNYQWEPGTQARFGAAVAGCPLCGPSTFELGFEGSTTQKMTLELFTATGGGTNLLDVGIADTTPGSEDAPVPGGSVDLTARIGGEINFILRAFDASDVEIDSFTSHFDFSDTVDSGVFNKFGTDSAGTGAIAIFLWGSSHDTPDSGTNPFIHAAFGGDPIAIDIAFTGQIPEPRTYVMFAMGLLALAGIGLVARRRVSARPRLA